MAEHWNPWADPKKRKQPPTAPPSTLVEREREISFSQEDRAADTLAREQQQKSIDRFRTQFPEPRPVTERGQRWLSQRQEATGTVPTARALQSFEAQFAPGVEFPVGSTMRNLGFNTVEEYAEAQRAGLETGPHLREKGRFDFATDLPSNIEDVQKVAATKLGPGAGAEEIQAATMQERGRVQTLYKSRLSNFLVDQVASGAMREEEAEAIATRAKDSLTAGYVGVDLPFYMRFQKATGEQFLKSGAVAQPDLPYKVSIEPPGLATADKPGRQEEPPPPPPTIGQIEVNRLRALIEEQERRRRFKSPPRVRWLLY